MMELTILTYNTLFAGRDGLNDHRAQAQMTLLDTIRPDVFLMQEARGLEANGGAWLYTLEAKTGMRGFLAPAPVTGQNVAIFIRPPLTPVAFEYSNQHFHHVCATLRVSIPSCTETLSFMTAHLCPHGAEIRRREAACLAVYAQPDKLTLLTGDFNAVSHHDTEPQGFHNLPAHHRTRYLSDDFHTADRRVMRCLESAGWVDIGHVLGAAAQPTVPTAQYVDSEFAVMRCDYVLASSALAQCAAGYEVIRTPLTDMASDHYPVLARFDLTRFAPNCQV